MSRNPIAKDLGSDKYQQRVKQVKRRKLVNDIREKELDDEIKEVLSNER